MPAAQDKDEQLNTAVENLFVQPQIACVTYLTATGAPTVVVPIVPQPFVASRGREGGTAESDAAVFLSHPRVGKHMRFDGRMLHAAPSSRRTTGQEREGRGDDETRITFLCNVWLNHRPVCSRPAPSGVVEKMSQLCRWVESEPGAAAGLAVGSDDASAAPLQPDPPPALAPGTELEEYETNDVDGIAIVKLRLRMPTLSECSTLLAAGAPDSLRVTCSEAMLLANPSAKRRKTVECIG